jgi:hypothetical protein
MSTTITIPAELMEYLRTCLHSELGGAADEIGSTTTQPMRERYPEWYDDGLTRLDRTRALLDAIGWADPSDPAPFEIDLSAHSAALIAGLEVAVVIAESDSTEAPDEQGRTDAAMRMYALRDLLAVARLRSGNSA